MLAINYIELTILTPDSNGGVIYQPTLIKIDSIDAIKSTGILVSGVWLSVREGSQGVVEKIQGAIREMNQASAPTETQPSPKSEPSADEIEATEVPF